MSNKNLYYILNCDDKHSVRVRYYNQNAENKDFPYLTKQVFEGSLSDCVSFVEMKEKGYDNVMRHKNT